MKEKSWARYLLLLEVIVLLVVLGLVGYRQWKLANEPVKQVEEIDNDDKQPEKPKDTQTDTEKPDTPETPKTPVVVTGFSDAVNAQIKKMTLEQKVAQLFVITPEMLTGTPKVTVTGQGTRTAMDQYPVGGLVYSKDNFQGKEQTAKMLSAAQTYYKEKNQFALLLGVTEEGGKDYSPVATANGFPVQPMASEFPTVKKTSESAAIVSDYLKNQGFNLNLAIHTTSGLSGDKRSYNGAQEVIQKFVSAQMKEYQQRNVISVLQTFPSNNSAMEKYAECIMVEDITSKELTGDETTSCMMSAKAIEQLRAQRAFKGALMSSPLNTESIIKKYKPAEASVKALLAGCDLLYLPADFKAAYQGILDGIKAGTITEERLNQSVGRILTLKATL